MDRKAALHTVTTQHQLMKWFTGDEINKSNKMAQLLVLLGWCGGRGVEGRERGGGGAQKTGFLHSFTVSLQRKE